MKLNKFSFTDEEFITIVNQISAKEIPMGQQSAPITTMDESIAIERLDSLGIIIFFVWIVELFGIAEDDLTKFMEAEDFTVRAIKVFVMQKATRAYDYATAKEYCERCL